MDRSSKPNRDWEKLIGRTNSLPPAEEDAVELEPQEVRVGVPPARRRDRGLQRDRRVELRHEPPRVLGLGRGGQAPARRGPERGAPAEGSAASDRAVAGRQTNTTGEAGVGVSGSALYAGCPDGVEETNKRLGRPIPALGCRSII